MKAIQKLGLYILKLIIPVVFGLFILTELNNKIDDSWIYNIHRTIYSQQCANGYPANDYLYISYRNGKRVLISRCILKVPGAESGSHFLATLETKLFEPFLALPKANYTDSILILAILRNAKTFLATFAKQLSQLSYPHHLIRVCFAEEGSRDNTFSIADDIAIDLQTKYGFAEATVYKLPISGNKFSLAERRNMTIEYQRRGHMAKARNVLTKPGLRNEKWIQWLDVDVQQFRPDLIKQFLQSNKEVMVASALAEYSPNRYFSNALAYRNYDLNSFNETVINGKAVRLHTHDFKALGREAPIQFVGACALMIKAECVRKGLHFPEKIIHSNGSKVQAIESEGLGLLARQMGFRVVVLTFVEVFHVPVY